MALVDLIELSSGSTRAIEAGVGPGGIDVIKWTHEPTSPEGGGRALVVRKSTSLVSWENMTSGLIGSWIQDTNGGGLIGRLLPVSISAQGYYLLRSDDLAIKGDKSYRWGLVRGYPKRDVSSEKVLAVFDTIPTLAVEGYVNLGLEIWNDTYLRVNITVKQTNVTNPIYSDYRNVICEFQDIEGVRLTRGGVWGILGVSSSTSAQTTTRHGNTVWFLSS